MFMFSKKCKLQGLNGITRLDRAGMYVVITNRQLHETGASSRFTLVNEAELWVHSIHGSQHAAVIFAQKHGH